MMAQKNPADFSAGFLNFLYKSKLESVETFQVNFICVRINITNFNFGMTVFKIDTELLSDTEKKSQGKSIARIINGW
jgi:hypothetical protein